MQTRIRQLRRMRGWTLQHLADLIGTTPQTVQRLETANMTVSMEWLQKFADAFDVHPADLIASRSSRELPFLGFLGKDGILRQQTREPQREETLAIDIPADHPVAVRVDEPVGDYRRGTILIANKFSGRDLSNVLGRDALVSLQGGQVLLRRVVKGRGETFTLVPLQADGDIRYDQTPEWAARIVMRIDYL